MDSFDFLHLTLGPIDGSKTYLKYFWYYERYQPKYQISNHRTIVLNNITESMQGLCFPSFRKIRLSFILGKYMCIGDDENEKLEFEMTIYVQHSTKSLVSYYPVIM